jgi:Zn-dependent peptidase ImmA (M78 family)
MKTKNIKEFANTLSQKYNTRDPFRIAVLNHINIYYPDIGENMGYFSSVCRIKSICINKNADTELQPFICAHELGHYFLHPHAETHALNQNSFLSTWKIERQANLFAVEFLLPDDLMKEYSDMGTYDIASMVGIPKSLARLKSL